MIDITAQKVSIRYINAMKRASESNSHFRRGFTIVELLIVIVVIAVLASIVIVAYNGVTSKANAAKNQTDALTVRKRAEAYYADNLGGNGLYPPAIATAATNWTTYTTNNPTGLGAKPSGVTLQASVPTSATAVGTVQYIACATAANANTASGFYVGYWDFTASAVKYYIGGSVVTGGSCPAGTAASTQ